MARLPNLVRLGSKLVLEIMPSVAATVIGGYLLTQLHFRTPEPTVPALATSTSDTPPTVGEERAAIRDVLKARREKAEVPAVVRPVAAAAPASAAAPAAAPAGAQMATSMDSINPNEPVEHAAPSRPNVAVAPPRRAAEAPRTQPETTASVYIPPPPPGLPVAPAAPSPDDPTPLATAALPPAPPLPPATQPATVPPPQFPTASLPPAMVPAAAPPVVASAAPEPPPAQPAEVQSGPVGSVLSGLSAIVGHAANATGNTVNWVIDLPGKAISAGGRVINPPPPPSRPFS